MTERPTRQEFDNALTLVNCYLEDALPGAWQLCARVLSREVRALQTDLAQAGERYEKLAAEWGLERIRAYKAEAKAKDLQNALTLAQAELAASKERIEKAEAVVEAAMRGKCRNDPDGEMSRLLARLDALSTPATAPQKAGEDKRA